MPKELYHYGVIGMKWGAHKARSYAADKNAYIRKQRDKKAAEKYRSGEYSSNQYRAAKRRNKRDEYRKNQKVIGETLKLTPKKGAKVSSIYNKYKDQAVKTIPHYKLKKGAKTAGKILYNLGSAAINTNVTTAGIKIAVNIGAKSLARGLAVNALKDIGATTGSRIAEDYPYKRKEKGGNK